VRKERETLEHQGHVAIVRRHTLHRLPADDDLTAVWLVEPGNHAEFTLKTHPGRVIKAKVDSIVWAQGQGQVPQSGVVPQTGIYPQVPGRFPVKLEVEARDRDLFLAAGAGGAGAIYTEHAQAIHILRMVILRIGTITDYLVLKLH